MPDSIHFFLPTAPDSSLIYAASYQPVWVMVSVLLAIVGAYAALGAASRATTAADAPTKLAWIVVSSLTFGVGTWSMHFIGMLALMLPCRVGYDLRLTLISMVPAILGGLAALGVVWRPAIRLLPIPLRSVLLGAGIGAMHYTGMAAMQLDGWVRYNPTLFALSIGVAIVLSYFALRATERAKAGKKRAFWAALMLGGAVSGTHYSAMAAAYFVTGDASALAPSFFTSNSLALMVSLATLLLALAALGFTELSRAISTTEKLRLSEAKLRTIIQAEPECIKIVDAQGRLLQMNPAGLAMIEADSLEQVAGQPIVNLIAPEYRAAFNQMHQRVLAGETGELVFEALGLNGGRCWLETHAVPMQDQGQTVQLAITRDITARKQAQDSLDESREKYRALSEAAFEAVFISEKGICVEQNTRAQEMFGYTQKEAVGRSGTEWIAPEDRERVMNNMKAGYELAYQVTGLRKDRSTFPAIIRGKMSLYQGRGVRVTAMSDISELKEAEEQIQTLAFSDQLTMLPNRRLLMDRLEQVMAASERHERQAALLMVDLDNFKDLNDTLGHEQGDLMLQQFAKRLSSCVRKGDTVARLGGDEFVVLLDQLDQTPLQAIIQVETVAVKILEALQQPYQLDASEISCTASIGITLFGEQHEGTVEPLKRAELAMYQAKAHGRNTLRFFDPKMQAVVNARVTMEVSLREAVGTSQFVLYYQPQVTEKGQITGVEALLRWQHPKRGMVSPAEFIPLAEETGMILPIGTWVLETACRQLVQWANQPGMAHLKVAVNVSAKQFHQRDFSEQVLSILHRTGANPSRLMLELTESLLVTDVEGVIAKMNAMKGTGVRFALDDFGTGYSSLSYLKRLPLDQLKIDQGFVRDILIESNDAVIAKMVIALADSLGLTVIAEGVETEAQRDFLAELGCHNYQGYLFSRPLTLQAFEEFARGR